MGTPTTKATRKGMSKEPSFGLRALRQPKHPDWDDNWDRAFGKGKYAKKNNKQKNERSTNTNSSRKKIKKI